MDLSLELVKLSLLIYFILCAVLFFLDIPDFSLKVSLFQQSRLLIFFILNGDSEQFFDTVLPMSLSAIIIQRAIQKRSHELM